MSNFGRSTSKRFLDPLNDTPAPGTYNPQELSQPYGKQTSMFATTTNPPPGGHRKNSSTSIPADELLQAINELKIQLKDKDIELKRLAATQQRTTQQHQIDSLTKERDVLKNTCKQHQQELHTLQHDAIQYKQQIHTLQSNLHTVEQQLKHTEKERNTSIGQYAIVYEKLQNVELHEKQYDTLKQQYECKQEEYMKLHVEYIEQQKRHIEMTTQNNKYIREIQSYEQQLMDEKQRYDRMYHDMNATINERQREYVVKYDEYEVKIKELNEECVYCQQRYTALEHEKSHELQFLTDNYEQQLQTHQQICREQHTPLIEQLQYDGEVLKNESTRINELYQCLQVKYVTLQHQYKEKLQHVMEYDAMKNELEEWKDRYQYAQHTHRETEKQWNDEKVKYQRQVDDMTVKHEHLHEEYNTLQGTHQELTQQYDKQSTDCSDMKRAIKSLEEYADGFKQQSECAKQQLNEWIQKYENTVKAHADEKSIFQQQCDEITQKFTDKETQYYNLQIELMGAKQLHEGTVEEYLKLKAEHESMTDGNDELKTQMDTLKHTYEEEKSQYQHESEEKCQHLMTEKNTIQQQYDEVTMKHKKLLEEKHQVEAQINDMQKKYDVICQQQVHHNQDAEQKYSALKDENQGLQKSIDEYQSIIERLKQYSTDEKQKIQAEYDNEIKSLKLQYQQSHEMVLSARTRYDELISSKNTLQHDYEQLKTQVQSVTQQYIEAKSECSTVNNELQELQQRYAVLAEREKNNTSNKALQEEYQMLQAEYNALKYQQQELLTERDQYMERIELLTTRLREGEEVAHSNENHNASNTTQKIQLLNSLKSELKIHLDDKVLLRRALRSALNTLQQHQLPLPPNIQHVKHLMIQRQNSVTLAPSTVKQMSS